MWNAFRNTSPQQHFSNPCISCKSFEHPWMCNKTCIDTDIICHNITTQNEWKKWLVSSYVTGAALAPLGMNPLDLWGYAVFGTGMLAAGSLDAFECRERLPWIRLVCLAQSDWDLWNLEAGLSGLVSMHVQRAVEQLWWLSIMALFWWAKQAFLRDRTRWAGFCSPWLLVPMVLSPVYWYIIDN